MTDEFDAGLLSPVRAGTPVEAEVADRAWLQAMLDAEAALARAQAGLGTMPAEAAEVISGCARAELFDVRAIAVAARETANPVVALVQALTAQVADKDPEAAEYVHRGSTSQDIFDTGAMLVARRALRLIRVDLTRTAQSLGELAGRHRDTPMAGRTLALHAVPTTFGLKAAGWRQLVLDARARIDALVLPVSLGGAAGTLAGYQEYATMDGRVGEGDLKYAASDGGAVGALDHAASGGATGAAMDGPAESGDYAAALTAAYAAETGLSPAILPWHALRTPMADLAAALSLTAGALGKIAADVQVLVRTEIGELAEPAVAGRGSSSAMPHKRNPVLSTLIRSAALQVPALAATLTQCLVAEDERSAGVWHAEWLPLRELLRLTGGAAHTAAELAEGLVVHPERMRENLDLTGSRVATERVAVVLAPKIGKVRAKALLTEAGVTAEQTGHPLAVVLGSHPEVAPHLDEADLVRLLDPAAYVGAAGTLVDCALRA